MENIRVIINRSDGYFKEFIESLEFNDEKNWKSFSISLSKVQKDVNLELTKLIDENLASVIEEESDEEHSDTDDDDCKRKSMSDQVNRSKKVRNN
ncbi:hypothetical protein WA026_017639 [Henosepilachna vigintioctopunctata]|uniref:Uncharacterized protein n=1 Tax=Henosepilachna vigintioctopunctata TaxID=420089 RepID=A0AAW1UW58_9CUCU